MFKGCGFNNGFFVELQKYRVIKKKYITEQQREYFINILQNLQMSSIKMISWSALRERRRKCCRFSWKSRQHNSYSIEDNHSNHLRPFRVGLFFFNLNPIYRNTNLISNTLKLQEFSKCTKSASSPASQHGPTHTI